MVQDFVHQQYVLVSHYCIYNGFVHPRQQVPGFLNHQRCENWSNSHVSSSCILPKCKTLYKTMKIVGWYHLSPQLCLFLPGKISKRTPKCRKNVASSAGARCAAMRRPFQGVLPPCPVELRSKRRSKLNHDEDVGTIRLQDFHMTVEGMKSHWSLIEVSLSWNYLFFLFGEISRPKSIEPEWNLELKKVLSTTEGSDSWSKMPWDFRNPHGYPSKTS